MNIKPKNFLLIITILSLSLSLYIVFYIKLNFECWLNFELDKNPKPIQILNAVCNMDNCFNYKNCPLFQQIKYYLKIQNQNQNLIKNENNNNNNNKFWLSILSNHPKRSEEVENSCFIIYYLDEGFIYQEIETELEELTMANQNANVLVWINIFNSEIVNLILTKFNSFIIVSSVVFNDFRPNYDIAIFDPEIYENEAINDNGGKEVDCNIIPKMKLAFIDSDKHFKIPEEIEQTQGIETLEEFDALNNSIDQYTFGIIYFKTYSGAIDKNLSEKYRHLYYRIIDYLSHGIIPVLFAPESIILRLPLCELINWTQILIKLPLQRAMNIQSVYEILTQISASNQVLQNYVYNGRVAFVTHLNSYKKLVNSVLNVMEKRLEVPGMLYGKNLKSEANNLRSLSSNSEWFQPTAASGWIMNQNVDYNVELFYKDNFCSRKYSTQEKFTIVILTYKRTAYLLKLLEHLNGLRNAHKILIIWNNPSPPGNDIKWPNISVPIQIILAKTNSLNNRFYPFSQIETDGILSLDDDVWIPKKSLEFAFRVWKANRNKLVGFPNRGVTWNNNETESSWTYGNVDNHDSLILTGATFIHKYYYYYYTYEMDQEIRNLVDKFMNCEDIAMNFLVSHLSQGPNIKVTPQIYFDCQNCGVKNSSLWLEPGHFEERNYCTNYLVNRYGYIPLQNIMFQADDFNI